MTYAAESEFGRWRIFSALVETNNGNRYTAGVGEYDITLDLITYPTGDVYRRPVRIIVNPKETLNEVVSVTGAQYEELTSVENGKTVEGYQFSSVFTSLKNIQIISGRLPKGISFRSGTNFSFGLYGIPEEAGDFTLQCQATTHMDLIHLTVKLHIDSKRKVPGTATLKWDNGPNVALSGVPSAYTIQWQASNDALGKSFHDLKNENEIKLKTQNYTLMSLRVKITAPGYDSPLYSDVKYITPLGGTVGYTSGLAIGSKITTGITGEALSIYHTAPETLHYQWRKRYNAHSAWKAIDGATKTNYTPVEADANYEIQVMVSAEWHTPLYSTPHQLPKMVNSQEPVAPKLQINTYFYNLITISNTKSDQEYCLTYTFGSIDWSKAVSSGYVKFDVEKDKTVYVYTRMKETNTRQVGTKVVYSKVYNGEVTDLAGLVLDKTRVSTKVGDVTALTVSPLPENFSGWNSSYQLKWYINGNGVYLFADEACSIPVTPGILAPNKTVYVKGTAQTSYVEVGVEKQVGPTQIYNAYCSFEVADAEGYYTPQYLQFDDVTLAPGESTTTAYTPYPNPAKVGALSFTKTQGESDLTITDRGDGTVSISAPSDAKAGDYFYDVKISGIKTQYISYLKITVTDQEAEIIIDGDNQEKQMLPIKVIIGSVFELPELPEEITIPRGYTFAGWDKGNVGDRITIWEDTVIRALWEEHTHQMKYIPASAPTCSVPGNTAYYLCEDCGIAFTDELGTHHKPQDSFILPAKEHVAGEAVKENVQAAEGDRLGSYEMAVYCTVCGEELTRTYTTVTPTGHELIHTDGQEATCTEEGIKAHWLCLTCGKRYADAAGEKEILDDQELMIEALGHEWGEWTVIKQPSAGDEGEETRVCTRCGEQETRKIAKRFTITIKEAEHGTVTVSEEAAEEGAFVTVTAVPDSGYAVEKVTLTTEDGVARDITADMSFLLPAVNVTVEANFRENTASVYAFTNGNDAIWTKGTDAPLDFTVKGTPDDTQTFVHFTGLELDGETVGEHQYTAAAGSVNISLKASYLETLAAGGHTLKAIFTNGEAETEFTVKEAAKPIDPTKYEDVAVPSRTFTFKKVWQGDREESIDFTLYHADGSVYHHGFDKDAISRTEWRYTAFFTAPAACYVIEKPVPGYQIKYVNVGVYADVTDRCCDGGTIINKKVPKTGDAADFALWLSIIALGVVGLTTTLILTKRKKVHK